MFKSNFNQTNISEKYFKFIWYLLEINPNNTNERTIYLCKNNKFYNVQFISQTFQVISNENKFERYNKSIGQINWEFNFIYRKSRSFDLNN